MHEVAVVSELVNAIFKELEKYKVSKVDEVTFTIGDLTNLGGEQMSFAYEIVTRDTILEGSELHVVVEPIEIECSECGFKGPANVIKDEEYGSHSIPVLSCPTCKGPVKVTAGQSCRVSSMRFEEED